MASSIELLALAKLSFWDSKPTATLTQTSVWATPNATTPYATCPFQSSVEDNWGGHSNVTNNTRYVVPVAGTYRVSGMITWTTNSLGVRAAEIMQNGSALSRTNGFLQVANNNFTTVWVPASNVVCAVGDYLELAGYQSSGANLNTVTSGTTFSIEFLHF